MDDALSPINRLRPSVLLEASERSPVPLAEWRTARFRKWSVALKLIRLFSGNACLRLAGSRTLPLRQQRILDCVRGLGMLWIRVAQTLLLLRPEISSPFGLSLFDIRDQGEADSFDRIREVVSEELGRPLEEVFDTFEEMPFAASTVSQIHRARLREEQTWVAVKVQQPSAEARFDKDLALFHRLIKLMKRLSIRSGMRWDDLFHELRQIKTRELNYYYEADALERLERNLTGQPIHVPQVFRDYTGRRVLVMEFVSGAFLSDCLAMEKDDPQRLSAWLADNNIDLTTVGERLFHSVYRQVFEENFFHGDLNTSTVILLKNSHLAFVECRSACSLDTENHEKQKMYLHSLAEQEYSTAAEIFFLLSSRLPRVDLNSVKKKLVRIWRVWETRVHIRPIPFGDKSLTYMTGQVNRVALESKFAPNWSFSGLIGAWVHLDNALAYLDPEFNYLEHLRDWFREAQSRARVSEISHLPSRLAASLIALHQLPKRVSEYNIFKEILIRRKAQVIQSSASKFDAFVATGFGLVSMVVLVLFLVFGAEFLTRYQLLDLGPLLGPQITEAMGRLPLLSGLGRLLWLVFLALAFLFFRTQKRRLTGRGAGRQEPDLDFEL